MADTSLFGRLRRLFSNDVVIRNIGGDQYLGYASIGNAMVGLVLASADDRLFMHGGSKKGWLVGQK